MYYCMNFSGIKADITVDNTETITKINSGFVSFELDLPITIEVENSSTIISDYKAKINKDLLKHYDVSKGIVNMTEKHPGVVDQIYLVTRLMNISYSIRNSSVLYIVKDLEKDDLTYMFAVEVGDN